MKLQRVRAVARKEFLHIIRDRRSLLLAVALPLMMLVLFGYALKMDVENVPLVVWDQCQAPASREFISRFAGSRYFSLRHYVRSYRELERAIDSREALAALVLPVDFERRLESGRPATAQLIVDGSDANSATFALGYANSLAQAYSEDVALREVRRGGPLALRLPLDARPLV